jgi:hypothetical protein
MRKFLFLALLIFVFVGCREEGDMVTTTVTGTIPPPTIITATVTTVVVGQDGTSLDNVSITGLGAAGRENPDGSFTIDASLLNSDGTLVTVTSPGHWPERRLLMPAGDGELVETFVMEPKVKAGDIEPTTGGIITLADNFTIELPANSIVKTANGDSYTGPVEIYVNHDAPEDAEEMLNSPGNVLAQLENGDLANLESLGMMDISLEAPGGAQLELDESTPVKVRMPLEEESMDRAPDEVDFWVLDPEGYWLPAGVATLGVNCYVVFVTSSGGYNCDVPRPAARICGRFVDAGGFPLTHSPFSVQLDGGFTCHAARIDCNGEFCAWVAADTPLAFHITDSCTGIDIVIPFDPVAANTATELGDIVVDLSNAAFYTNLTDCSGAGVPNIDQSEIWANGYGGNGGKYFAAMDDGQAVVSLTNCDDSDVLVQAFTRDYRASSPVYRRSADDATPLDMTVCGELDADEYFTLSIDGTEITITELAPVYWPENGEFNWLVRAAGSLNGEEYSLFLNFSDPAVGAFANADAMGAIYRLEQGQDYGEGRVYVDPEQELGLTGIDVSAEGDVFEGSFDATMNLQNDASQSVEAVNLQVTATFRIKL